MKDVEIKVNGSYFVLIDAENLSLDDEFMKYEPKTKNESKAKELISEAICSGVKNFYQSKCVPSFAERNENIRFSPGKNPAVGETYTWWKEIAKEYYPKRNSRLGTILQYSAFLGVLIKRLVQEGNSVEWSWHVVCNNSFELEEYWNHKNEKGIFISSSSRYIGGFFVAFNPRKRHAILAEDVVSSCGYSAAIFYDFDDWAIGEIRRGANSDGRIGDGVGWIVLDA